MPADWSPPQRPFEYAEQALLSAILDGDLPPGSNLPGERELAARLGVTRPTLREVLARLGRDGWLTIQHGKPTRVNDYWREGGLNVLSSLVRASRRLPADFVPNLLEVRQALAPAYARQALERSPAEVLEYLAGAEQLDDTPEAYAAFDWKLHQTLTVLSGNPIYALIFNGFAGFYEQMARAYFANPEARQASQRFYTSLGGAARRGSGAAGEAITRAAMQASQDLWRAAGG